MKKDINFIENRIKLLKQEIIKIRQEKIFNAGKIATKYFEKESDFNPENIAKFISELKTFFSDEVKNGTGK
jgi:DNA-directed RNA polymerase subunit F